MSDFKKRFLQESDKTGRFVVTSLVTGKRYYVEPLSEGKEEKLWGDVDPATKKLTGSYGNKYNGAISRKDSMITEENGFDEITEVRGSVQGEIERRDKEYQQKMSEQ